MDNIVLETHCELLAAIRELAELVTLPNDKLSYLQQASCLADNCVSSPLCQSEDSAFSLDYFKWMLSYVWNIGVQAY